MLSVRTGDLAYFDNAETAIRPEHVMASGALPPCFRTVPGVTTEQATNRGSAVAIMRTIDLIA